MLADATHLPFCDHTVDAVVTDFPYGQSVCIKKSDTMDMLYGDALEEIQRVLKTGKESRGRHPPGYLADCSGILHDTPAA